MESILTCKRCKIIYDTEQRLPHDLPCHHVICTFCVEDLLSKDKKCYECQKELNYSESKYVPLSFATVRVVRLMEISVQDRCDVLDHQSPQKEARGSTKQTTNAKVAGGARSNQARNVVGKRLKSNKNKHSKKDTRAKKSITLSSGSMNKGATGVGEGASNAATPLQDEAQTTKSKEPDHIPYSINGGTCSDHGHPIIGFCQTCYITACKDCLVTRHFKSSTVNKRCIIGSVQTMLDLFIKSCTEMLDINRETIVKLSLKIQAIGLYIEKRIDDLEDQMDSQGNGRQEELMVLIECSFMVKEKERELSNMHVVIQYFRQIFGTFKFTEDLLTDIQEVTCSIDSLRNKINEFLHFAETFCRKNPDFSFNNIRLEFDGDEDEHGYEKYMVTLREAGDPAPEVERSSTSTEDPSQNRVPEVGCSSIEELAQGRLSEVEQSSSPTIELAQGNVPKVSESSTPTEELAQGNVPKVSESSTPTEELAQGNVPKASKSSTPSVELAQEVTDEESQDTDKQSKADEFLEAQRKVLEYILLLTSQLLFAPVENESTNLRTTWEDMKERAKGDLRKPLQIPSITKYVVTSEDISQDLASNIEKLTLSPKRGPDEISNSSIQQERLNGTHTTNVKEAANSSNKMNVNGTATKPNKSTEHSIQSATLNQSPTSLPLLTSVMTPSLAFAVIDAQLPTPAISQNIIKKFQFQVLSLACDHIDKQPVLIADPDVFQEELCAYEERTSGIGKVEGFHEFEIKHNPNATENKLFQEKYLKRRAEKERKMNANTNLRQSEGTSKEEQPENVAKSSKPGKPETATLPDPKEHIPETETETKPDEIGGAKPAINSKHNDRSQKESQEKGSQVSGTSQSSGECKKVVFKTVPTDPAMKKAFAQAQQLTQDQAIDSTLMPFLANILSTNSTSARELALASAEAINTNRVPPVLSPREEYTANLTPSTPTEVPESSTSNSIADGRRNRRPAKRMSRSQKLLQEKKSEGN